MFVGDVINRKIGLPKKRLCFRSVFCSPSSLFKGHRPVLGTSSSFFKVIPIVFARTPLRSRSNPNTARAVHEVFDPVSCFLRLEMQRSHEQLARRGLITWTRTLAMRKRLLRERKKDGIKGRRGTFLAFPP